MVITTSPFVRTYTLEEFWELPRPKEYSRLELIKGVLYMTPPPDGLHRDIATALIENLRDAIRDHGYAGHIYVPQAPIWVDDDTYLEPDVMYVSESLRQQMNPDHFTSADLVIEIASPSTQVYDRTTKADTYHALKVREMWLVYPATQTVEVRYFESDETANFTLQDILNSKVLPDINLPLSRIFQL